MEDSNVQQLINLMKVTLPHKAEIVDLCGDTQLLSLGLNSIEFITLLGCMEEELGIDLDSDAVNIDNLNSISDIAKLMND